MLIVHPETIGQWGERKLMSGFLQCQQAKLSRAMNNNQRVDGETLVNAAQFIRQASGIALSESELLRLLDLYPFAKTTLAQQGWQHASSEQVVLDVVANSLLCSRWPTQLDCADLQNFCRNLQFAAQKFGYRLA